ncbi:3-hydroxyacyl-CoA dehydrogenase [Patulibacter medicamentivorans]|jgi:NAD(P)-dependent dehydrogenase (short-subunit alcohol dehydrogenase family)|uniref:3-hydroxyacyl-CoA dehydrogenase n=1 Tax=Patulibacter medicamentivorans TaxID=1097667 RepID=H0E423_9ACTN|nr:3-hydroxyacyl-CoA dehydrogenase [Patulibacter medicamentivorans]EHN11588.1 3-hydroxyacyl-CoA dehydrogenase [Patulibacter medicamentivorans]
MAQIAGKSALVTGGASGLGQATVRRLHADGAHVTIADVQEDKGQALVAELGERAQFVKTDVTDEDAVKAAVEAAAGVAPLVATVSCAGTGWPQQVFHHKKGPHPMLPFETVLKINLFGTFNALRFSAEAMSTNEPNEDGERGVLINTASVAAFDGQIGQVAYSASKGGIVGMTLPVARDLARYGIRNMTIAPGLFDTPLLAALPEEAKASLGAQVPFPPRLGHPSEYADLAAHIISNPLLNGETIRLDGAIRMAPK